MHALYKCPACSKTLVIRFYQDEKVVSSMALCPHCECVHHFNAELTGSDQVSVSVTLVQEVKKIIEVICYSTNDDTVEWSAICDQHRATSISGGKIAAMRVAKLLDKTASVLLMASYSNIEYYMLLTAKCVEK